MTSPLAISRYPLHIPLEKLASVAVVALALLLLNPFQVQEAVIVLGQGHFLACYFYQYRNGKIDRAYLLKYALAALLLFGGYYFYPNLFLLVTVASVYFVLHLLVDERFLAGQRPTLQRGLAFLPFFLIYLGMIVDNVFVGQATLDFWLAQVQNLPVSILGVWITPYCLMAAGGALILYGLYMWRRKMRPESFDLYCFLGALVLALLYYTNHVPNHYYLMGAVILFHYSSWYVHYGIKFKDDPVREKQYLLHMFWINALVFGLYGIYRLWPDALVVDYVPANLYAFKSPSEGNVLAYLFSPAYFYLWTLLHFVSTARLSDLAYFRKA